MYREVYLNWFLVCLNSFYGVVSGVGWFAVYPFFEKVLFFEVFGVDWEADFGPLRIDFC